MKGGREHLVEPHFEVVGLGAAIVDILTEMPERLERDAAYPTQKLSIEPGGSVGNVLYGLRKLGRTVSFITSVGDDILGDWYLNNMIDSGIDISCARHLVGEKTPCAVVLYGGFITGRNILYDGGLIERLAPPIDPKSIRGCSCIHSNFRFKEAVIEASRIASEGGATVSINLGIGDDTTDVDRLIQLADLVVAAEQYAVAYGSGRDVAEVAANWIAQGPKAIVVTYGEAGSTCWTCCGDVHNQKSFPVDVVDTTGAGDAFHAALLHYYMLGEPIRRCLRIASAAGAMACTKVGARNGMPTEQALLSFLGDQLAD